MFFFSSNVMFYIQVTKPTRKAMYRWKKICYEIVSELQKLSDKDNERQIKIAISEFIDGGEENIKIQKNSKISKSIKIEKRNEELIDIICRLKKATELLKNIAFDYIELAKELDRQAEELLMKEDRQ